MAMDEGPDEFRPTAGAPAGETRRVFLQSGLAAGGIVGLATTQARGTLQPNSPNPLEDCHPWPPPPSDPVIFTPDVSLSVRTRLSAFEMPDDKVTQLRKAYKLLR